MYYDHYYILQIFSYSDITSLGSLPQALEHYPLTPVNSTVTTSTDKVHLSTVIANSSTVSSSIITVNSSTSQKLNKDSPIHLSYIVTYTVWEQLMASSKNFQLLQCWTNIFRGRFSVHVVEPNVKVDSSGLAFSFANASSTPKLSDIFNMSSWYKQWPVSRRPLATMDSRSEFLSVISTFEKNAILVQFDYGPYKQRLCEFSWDTTNLMAELKHYPLLNISRKVCINVNKLLTSEYLRALILGDIPLQNTVIIIDEWRGFGSARTNIKSECSKSFKYGYLKPSAMVMEDAKMYADKYLGGFGQYLSVSARFEKVSQKYANMTQQQRRSKITEAMSMIKKNVSTHKEQKQINKVYLSYDYGRFGSSSFRYKNFYDSSDLLVKFQQDLYNNEMIHDEYEKSFMIFKLQHPAYIAMVQMTIAAKGKCLLQIGKGHCIDFTSYLFISFHRPNVQCMYKSIL